LTQNPHNVNKKKCYLCPRSSSADYHTRQWIGCQKILTRAGMLTSTLFVSWPHNTMNQNFVGKNKSSSNGSLGMKQGYYRLTEIKTTNTGHAKDLW
jgi:hypothetical protein